MSGSRARVRFVPVAVNHRGRPVPVWLGIPLVAVVSGWPAACAVLAWGLHGAVGPHARFGLSIAAGAALVFAVGLYDDFRPSRTHGVLHQIAEVFRGRMTPGAVKLAVIVLAAGLVAWALGARGVRLAVAVPVIAGAANLWNLLDVAPGRSLKAFLPAAAGLALAQRGTGFPALILIAALAGAFLLYFDLREMGMLGDAGANLLGFVVGVGLFLALDTVGLGMALGVIVALHVLSETVTLSGVVRSVPPLRWLDDLGRLRGSPPEGPVKPSDGS